MIEPYTSLYLWPDGQTYSCFVYVDPKKAKCIQVSCDEARLRYPDDPLSYAVKKIAIERFNYTQ